MGDFMGQLLDFYTANAEIVLPILATIAILGFSLGAGMLGKDGLMRTTLVGLVALLFIALSFVDIIESPFPNELFLNIGTMLLITLVALLYSGLAKMAEDWLYPVMAVAGLALFSLLFVNQDNLTSDLAGNLAAVFVAAWPVAFFVRQRWQWSPEQRDRKMVAELRSSRKQKQREDLQRPDFTILVQGSDEGALQQKVTFLRESDLSILEAKSTEHDEATDVYYQMMQARVVTAVKDQETTLLDGNVAQVRILAYPDTAKRVYQQITEVLEEKERQRLDSPPSMVHMEMHVAAPEKLFSAYLEEQIFELARRWRYGDEEHLQDATEALLDWAQEMQFIQPTDSNT